MTQQAAFPQPPPLSLQLHTKEAGIPSVSHHINHTLTYTHTCAHKHTVVGQRREGLIIWFKEVSPWGQKSISENRDKLTDCGGPLQYLPFHLLALHKGSGTLVWPAHSPALSVHPSVARQCLPTLMKDDYYWFLSELGLHMYRVRCFECLGSKIQSEWNNLSKWFCWTLVSRVRLLRVSVEGEKAGLWPPSRPPLFHVCMLFFGSSVASVGICSVTNCPPLTLPCFFNPDFLSTSTIFSPLCLYLCWEPLAKLGEIWWETYSVVTPVCQMNLSINFSIPWPYPLCDCLYHLNVARFLHLFTTVPDLTRDTNAHRQKGTHRGTKWWHVHTGRPAAS